MAPAARDRTAALFKLALLLGTRGGELRGLRWSELDLDGATWNLPAERTKTKTARRIPLSRAAVELLRGLRQAGEYVFPGCRGRGRTSLKDAQRRIAERAPGSTAAAGARSCGRGSGRRSGGVQRRLVSAPVVYGQ